MSKPFPGLRDWSGTRRSAAVSWGPGRPTSSTACSVKPKKGEGCDGFGTNQLAFLVLWRPAGRTHRSAGDAGGLGASPPGLGRNRIPGSAGSRGTGAGRRGSGLGGGRRGGACGRAGGGDRGGGG